MSEQLRRLACVVAELERAEPGERLELVDECSELLRKQGRIEAELFCRARDALIAHGFTALDFVQGHAPLVLDVGESVVLLVSDADATSAILTARHRSAVRGDMAAPDAAINAADALRRALIASRQPALARDLVALDHFDVDLLSAQRKPVDGDSLGLAACASAMSLVLNKPPPSDTACVAALAADGQLGAVSSLEAKLGALQRAWPTVKRVVVADAQRTPIKSSLTYFRARTALDALREMDLLPRRGMSLRWLAPLSAVALALAWRAAHLAEAKREPIAAAAVIHRVESRLRQDRADHARSFEAIAAARQPARGASRASEVSLGRGGRSAAARRNERNEDAAVPSLAIANEAPLLHP